MKSFIVTTLGCKVNRYESEAISEQLVSLGWRRTGKGDEADLCIINTCTVTRKAATQSRQSVRKAIRTHPRALIVTTGCYAQVAPQVFRNIDGVHCVIGNTLKDQIAQISQHHDKNDFPRILVPDFSEPCAFQDMPITRFGSRTRSFLKIQDGCDAFCAYCIIPYARGRSRSLKPGTIAERIGTLKVQGYSEVVLCGINLGRYGPDLNPPTSLTNLLRSIDGDRATRWLRLSSIEPTELSQELIAQLKTSKRVCRHLHIPLQSGDQEILERMNRSYGPGFFRDLIHQLVGAMPGVAIGVDVLVGFPGETDRAFENTRHLIEALPIAYLHVFPFSLLSGTAAEHLSGHLPPETIKERAHVMRRIGHAKRTAFYQKALGSPAEILVEGKRDKETGLLKGLTDNYIPVYIEGPDLLFHQHVLVRPNRLEGGRVLGECLSCP